MAARRSTRRRSTSSGSRPGRPRGPRIWRAGAAKTRADTSAWLAGLGIPQKLSRLADPPADQGSLAAESAVAASALAGLEEDAGHTFGHHEVIVLFCDDLSGALPPAS